MASGRRVVSAFAGAVLVAGLAAAATASQLPPERDPTLLVTLQAEAGLNAQPPTARAAFTAGDETAALTAEADPSEPTRPVDVQVTGACDPLDAADCVLPFPNDVFTTTDPSTDTGRRVSLDVLSMPRNSAGRPIDPTEWNRNDGFSPGSPILTRVPGLDLHTTWGSALDNIQDLSWYERPDAPVVVLDAVTGERHPVWTELDTNARTTDDERLLIVRPAVNFTEGHRYVVALRELRDAEGTPIEPGPAFVAYRDGHAAADDPRAADLEEVFATLVRAGVERDDLYLAWDFTIASERSLSERALAIRDDAFAGLGDTDLADGVVDGAPPRFTIDSVEDVADGPTMRHVEGTITVPNYLTPQVEVGVVDPVAPIVEQLLDAVPPEVDDALDPVLDPVPIGVDDLVGRGFVLPGTRFNTVGSDDGLPVVDPLQPTVEVPFTCNLARGSDRSPSDPFLYGHGLLGGRGEADGGSTQGLRQRGFSPCAVDWWGMSTSDLPTVAAILVDASHFPSLADRSQQAFLNFLFLGRALAHPDGFLSHPAFRSADGRPLIRPEGLAYVGNSQGAIMGGALTALAPDLHRSVLGVPGMNYSTLLNRSVDWEGQYGEIFALTYPDSIDQQLVFVLMQMLWDRAESNGYAHHMTTDPLRGTPAHEVFLQVAFADHQVANVAAEVEARTIGARLAVPVAPPGLHWSVDPTFGLPPVDGDTADVGSVLVYWFSDGRGLGTPPNGNVPMSAGRDPHEDPRRHGPAVDQVAHWLRTGDLLDICGPSACVIPPP